MFHCLLVDGKYERFDGEPSEVEAKLDELCEVGMNAAHLFSAKTEDDYHRKLQAEKDRNRVDTI